MALLQVPPLRYENDVLLLPWHPVLKARMRTCTHQHPQDPH